ncbi:hypothetical protein BC940DRAFT_305866 [Gongronella butleri]|nr:hypothetical protein BC940DRAFT_305866 [Gongronella butleri]
MPRLPTLFAQTLRQQQCLHQRLAVASVGRCVQSTLFQQLKTQRTSFSTSSQQRVHQSSKQHQEAHQQHDNYYYYQHVVTETTILHSFPRPNLTPTLHYTLFADLNTSSANNGNNDRNKKKTKKKCKNCQGPHETDHCPC